MFYKDIDVLKSKHLYNEQIKLRENLKTYLQLRRLEKSKDNFKLDDEIAKEIADIEK